MDTTKIRNVLGGWLYAYELPPSPQIPNTDRSESPDEVERQKYLQRLHRDRTMCMTQSQAEDESHMTSRVKDELIRRGLRREVEELSVDEGVNEEEEGVEAKRQSADAEVVSRELEEEEEHVAGVGRRKWAEDNLHHKHPHEVDEEDGEVYYGDDSVTIEIDSQVVPEDHCREDSDDGVNHSADFHRSLATSMETYVYAMHRKSVSSEQCPYTPIPCVLL